MKLKFIGTGSGKTSLKRFHSSILISNNNYNLLIDAGEGISKALLAQKIEYNSINAILISHFHADHIFGLNSLITQMKMANRKEPLEIYIYKDLRKNLMFLMELGYIFKEGLDFEIIIVEINVENKIPISEDFSFIARKNRHVINKYNLKTKIEFVSLSFLFNLCGNKILYSADISDVNDLLLFRNEEIDFLITEGTHISPTEINKAIGELKPKYTYITHINEDDSALFEWHKNLTGKKAYFTKLASDGLEIIL